MSDNILLLPHLRVQNANALSSPFTIGFPAMTAWLGAVHALERKLNACGFTARFSGVGVISHAFGLQTYKGPGDYVYSIMGTGNPLEPKSEKGKPKGNAVRPSFVEEARCHLEASIILEYNGIEAHEEEPIIEKISHIIHSGMKLAGGDILDFQLPRFFRDFNKVKPKLMPGYAIVERRDLMQNAMEQGQDAIDAMLDYLAIHHNCHKEEINGQTTISWQSKRKATGPDGKTGWIVPLATGFQGISELGEATNQRDPEVLHRFAESVVTLGEFKMAYKFDLLEQLLWCYHVEPEQNLYVCQQQSTTIDTDQDEYDY